jgi:hypothetical protein
MTPTRSSLVLNFTVVSAACAVGYLGHNAGGLVAVSIFGNYAHSRAQQGAVIFIAILVGVLSLVLPDHSRSDAQDAFNHWFWVCAWVVAIAATVFWWRRASTVAA